MNSWAAPGKQCVCVDDNWQDTLCRSFGMPTPSRVPMINEVLTISEVLGGEQYPMVLLLEGQVALSFVELDHDFLFSITHFRPLITEEDDVEMFRSIVKEEEEKV